MQVKIADAARAPAFNVSKLNAAFRHKANGSGVFESGQHPIIVGQAAYNSAYGTNFVGQRATATLRPAPERALRRAASGSTNRVARSASTP